MEVSSLFQLWPFSRKRSSTSANKTEKRVSEQRRFSLQFDLSSLSCKEISCGFELGGSIQLKSKGRFCMRPEKVNSKMYWGAHVCLAQCDNLDSIKELRAKLSLELRNPKSDIPSRIMSTNEQEIDFKKEQVYGWRDFLDFNDVDRYKFPNGKLLLLLTITMFGPPQQTLPDGEEPTIKKPKSVLVQESRDSCTSDIFNALADRHMHDLIIKTNDDEDIEAHCLVLSARSKRFKEEISRLECDADGKMVIRVNYPNRVMKILLCHMYKGTLEFQTDKDPKKMDMELLKAVGEAASEYGLEHLKNYNKQLVSGFTTASK